MRNGTRERISWRKWENFRWVLLWGTIIQWLWFNREEMTKLEWKGMQDCEIYIRVNSK
jgi:hypothetical protein